MRLSMWLLSLLLLRLVACKPLPEPEALWSLRDSLDTLSMQQLRWSATEDACGAPECNEGTCNWAGVACSRSRVVGINLTTALPAGTMTGTIAAAVFSLPNLRYLVVPGQRLTGTLPELPKDSQDMRFLQVVDLHDNSLTGSLPATWGYLPTLQFLDLSSNTRISGSIPPLWKQLAPRAVNLTRTDVCGSAAEIRGAWASAAVALDASLAPCADSSSTRRDAAQENKAKYTVLLSMYIVASIFIVTSVVFVVGHSCLCRNRPPQQPDAAGPAGGPSPAPAERPAAPHAPGGPPPTLIIMPGSQMFVGYPVSGPGLKGGKPPHAAEAGAGDVEMGTVLAKPEERSQAGGGGEPAERASEGGAPGAPSAAAAAAAAAGACLGRSTCGCVSHGSDRAATRQ